MAYYKIKKEELDCLVRKIYELSCNGYLDLKDCICDSLVNNFLDDKEIINDCTNLNDTNREKEINLSGQECAYSYNFLGNESERF
jgi:hypothetical protein